MSFDFYFAGTYTIEADYLLLDRHSCRLMSQLNDRKRTELWVNEYKKGNKNKIFIDSGAFTAWTKNKEIDIDEYINYLNTNTNELELFASLDNIPGEFNRTPTHKETKESPIISWQNYLYMREKIVEKDKLLPVFHIGEDFSHLNTMLNTTFEGKHIPYIALGGTVGLSSKVKDDWYNVCFKVIKDSNNPNVKTHAFGMTSLPLLEKYPFTSCDSTAWIMAGANGQLCTKYGRVIISDIGAGRDKHIDSLPLSIQNDIKTQVEKSGITLEQTRVDYKARAIVNANFFQDWADNYKFKGTKIYQKRLF